MTNKPPQPLGILTFPYPQACAVCGAPGADIQITRPLPFVVDMKADCSPVVSPANAIEIAFVSRHHLPAAFKLLPKRAREHAVGAIWREIDELRGRAQVAVRIPPVRTKLIADAPLELAVPPIEPHYSLAAVTVHPCVLWARSLAGRVSRVVVPLAKFKRAKLYRGAVARFAHRHRKEAPLQQT